MGQNYRWSELHAALGLVALERFPEPICRTGVLWRDYLEEGLSDVPGITPAQA